MAKRLDLNEEEFLLDILVIGFVIDNINNPYNLSEKGIFENSAANPQNYY